MAVPGPMTRVLAQEPAIFILDEATAHVDPQTESIIDEGLDAYAASRSADTPVVVFEPSPL